MTSNTTDLQTLADNLQEKLQKKWEEFDVNHDDSWRDIFKIYPSQHSQETDIEINLWNLTSQSSASKDSQNKNVTPYVHKLYETGFSLAIHELEKGWTPTLDGHCSTLFKFFTDRIEEDACAVFEEILTSPKFEKNRRHPVFSREAYENMVIDLGKSRDSEPYTVLKPKILMVPTALQFEALTQIPQEYFYDLGVNLIINPYLKNPHAWFVLTDAPHGFKCFERTAPEVSVLENREEHLVHFKISARYSFGCTNPHAVFASTGEENEERIAA